MRALSGDIKLIKFYTVSCQPLHTSTQAVNWE